MPITMLPPIKERTWPADLDERAALDMKGLLQERPNRPRPSAVKDAAPQPSAPCRECGALQRRIAKLERAAHERRRKYNELDGRFRRRNARVSALEELLADARKDLLAAERQDGKNERILSELNQAIQQKDAEIARLRDRVAAMELEERESRKVISTVLRAHDILAAKHRRVA